MFVCFLGWLKWPQEQETKLLPVRGDCLSHEPAADNSSQALNPKQAAKRASRHVERAQVDMSAP